MSAGGDPASAEAFFDWCARVVESRREVANGATVVALVRGEATVKRVYRERGRIRLQPANERLAPLVVRRDDVEIRGAVIAVLRRYR